MNGKPRINRRGFLRNVGSAAIGVAATTSPPRSTSRAQERFPAREINWIIYQAPGGSIDTTARIIQPYLEKNGVTTNLDYVLGAGGPVGGPSSPTRRPE